MASQPTRSGTTDSAAQKTEKEKRLPWYKFAGKKGNKNDPSILDARESTSPTSSPSQDEASLPQQTAPNDVTTETRADQTASASRSNEGGGAPPVLPEIDYDCYFDIEVRTDRKWYKKNIKPVDSGRVYFKLDSDRLPATCRNFSNLCKERQYNQFVFHEVSRDYMQSGAITFGKDFQGRPLGDVGELHRLPPPKDAPVDGKSSLSHKKPYLLSALRGSSKFIITSDDVPWLDKDYVVFGRVAGGDSEKFVKKVVDTWGTISRRPTADISIKDCGIKEAALVDSPVEATQSPPSVAAASSGK